MSSHEFSMIEKQTRLEKGADPKTAPKFICTQSSYVDIFDEDRKSITVQPWPERFRAGNRVNLVFVVQGEHYAQFSGPMKPLSPFPHEAVAVAKPASIAPKPPASPEPLDDEGEGEADEHIPGLPSGESSGATVDSDNLPEPLESGDSADETFDTEEDKNAPVNEEPVPGIPVARRGTVKPANRRGSLKPKETK